MVSTAEYGKVFISIESTTGNLLTDTEKSSLITSLSPFTVASITPVIVDPQKSKLILGVTFKFNSSMTTETATSLASKISTTLTSYNSDNLAQFEGAFRHSKVTGLIDDTDTSILNNTTTVTLAKLVTPITTSSTSYTLNFIITCL